MQREPRYTGLTLRYASKLARLLLRSFVATNPRISTKTKTSRPPFDLFFYVIYAGIMRFSKKSHHGNAV